MVNTITCDVEFPVGKVRECAAKIIAKNALSIIDDEGFSKEMLRSVTDFKKDHAAANQKDKYFYSSNGRR